MTEASFIRHPFEPDTPLVCGACGLTLGAHGQPGEDGDERRQALNDMHIGSGECAERLIMQRAARTDDGRRQGGQASTQAPAETDSSGG